MSMAQQKTKIIVTHTFEGIHKWDEAPDDVAFLRNWHRHLFTVRLHIPIHGDREKEFLMMQERLRRIINGRLPLWEMPTDRIDTNNRGPVLMRKVASCESIASMILNAFPDASCCEVWEDMENGAVVEQEAI